MTKYRFAFVTAVMLLAFAARSARAQQELPAELKRLEPRIGNWDSTLTAKPSEWARDGYTRKGTVTGEWTVNGRFLQIKSVDEEKRESMSIVTWDTRVNAYRIWNFDGRGFTSEWEGQWDEATKSINWKGTLPNGMAVAGKWLMGEKDKITWQVTVTNADGKVMIDLEAQGTRKKQ